MRIMYLFAVAFLSWLPNGMTPLPIVSADQPRRRGSEAVIDEVYLQEVGRQIPSSVALTSVASFGQRIIAGSDQGLFVVDGEQLLPVAEMSQPIRRLVSTESAMWAIASDGLYRLEGSVWQKLSGESFNDLTAHLGETIVASERRLWRVVGEGLQPYSAAESPFPIARIISHCETLYVLGSGRLTFVDGNRIGARNVYGWPSDKAWDWGMLPSLSTRDALSQGSRLYIATDRGLAMLRGMLMTVIRGEQGLCYEDAHCLAKGFDDDLWIGTTRGAIRMVDGAFHYFAGRRWLPDEQVNAIAVSDRAAYFATPKGLGVIEYEPYTLQKKADYYERHLDEWGQRRLGFTHKLEWDGKRQEYVREVSDNDGGYTGNYLAAQAYRYAVTKDSVAREQAVQTFQALRWLESMTSMPGFLARSVWAKGEVGHQADHGSGGAPAEWHDTADGLFEWKGDTSSDEVCSHFYATRLFLDHVAQGEEVEQAKRHLASIAAHIANNGWKLIDVDGQPTRWGRWDPEYFTTEEGMYDRGLQALEVLSFMKTAHVLAGDEQAGTAYDRLVALGYPDFTLRQRNTFPPDGVLHFLDELGFWSYANLLAYEQDPLLRGKYRRSLERSYELVRIEQNPWFNFVYGALTGNECEVGPSVRHLREWPLDLRVWSFQNSHRADLRTPVGYEANKAGIRAFSPRETEPMRWDHWTMQADGGSSNPDVIEPGAWLLAYWMGRYHGYITPPTTTDPAALQVKRTGRTDLGAKPYTGPPRPDLAK
ncbi:hypothetical protein I41_23240 [Lacipirellula limnantheis]|uniref:Uncharacterized protein n=2 Tax=Lacipirellula limnantheis TaxID=2528024 RepID=A0A517TXM8_9BACT|nr:hypothetical protein I41_23240 [Lacipirellula limnantheis]